MKITVEVITPDVAKRLLEHNSRNRNVKMETVERYARDMSAGAWQMTGEAIKINGSGLLLDGQHRLLACVTSGATFQTVVARDVPEAAQAVMDSGKPRRFSDALQIKGVKGAHQASGIINALYRIKHMSLETKAPSTSELLPFYRKYSDEIDRTKIYNIKSVAAPAGALGALCILDPVVGSAFTEVQISGQPFYTGCASHVLREKIIAHRLRKVRPQQSVLLWTTIHAFNLFRTATPVKNLQWHEKPMRMLGIKHEDI